MATAVAFGLSSLAGVYWVSSQSEAQRPSPQRERPRTAPPAPRVQPPLARPPRAPSTASLPAQAAADPAAALQRLAVLSLGSPVDAVSIGDVTGDGRNDVVVSTHQNPAGSGYPHDGDFKVSVFVQQADGTLAAPLQAPFPGFLMHLENKSLALVDLNKDGLRDIVLAYGGGLYVFEGAAAGQLSGRAVPGFSSEVSALVTMDVNRDGNADIAAFDGFRVRMFLGDGQGGLNLGYTFSTTPVGVTNLNSHMAAGDLNGDGLVDLAFYDGNNQGAVYLQTAAGLFEHWPYLFNPYPAVYFTAMAVADFDADGDQDFLLATRQSDRTRPISKLDLYPQSGGQLLTPVRWGQYHVAASMIGADIDGDGRQDLVAVRSVPNENAVIGYSRQKPEGGFDTEVWFPLTRFMYSTSPRGLAAGDVTGDGCTDIAVGSGSDLVVFKAQCEPPMTTGGRLPPELLVAPGGASAGAVSLQAAVIGEARAGRASRTSTSRTVSNQTQAR